MHLNQFKNISLKNIRLKQAKLQCLYLGKCFLTSVFWRIMQLVLWQQPKFMAKTKIKAQQTKAQ